MNPLWPPRRWQLNLVFYAMAAIGILTIVATMYLSEITRGVVRGFIDSNQFWAERLGTLTELEQAAVDLDMRAKPDDKADATTVRGRRKPALEYFDAALARLRDGLQGELAPTDANRVARHIGDITQEIDDLEAASDRAIDRFAAGDLDGAAAAAAEMDQDLSRAMATAANLQRLLQALQRQAFAEQQRYVEDIQYVKHVFAVIVLVLVVSAIFIGQRLSRLSGEADEHRRKYRETMEARERDLEQANERLEATIAARTAQLSTSEGKFRTLVGNIPGACYRCADDADYTMEFISDAILDICGYPASDFIDSRARTYASVIHPEDLQMVADLVAAGIAARQQYTIEYRLLHRDGSIRWVYEKGQGVFGADGKVVHVDGAILDITARKDLEAQLAGQHQMAMLGQVAATVSHELRNPLGAIRNSMALMRQLTAGKELGVEKAIDRVDRNIERCSIIIGDLLDYTRKKPLDRMATPIDAWLTEMLAEHVLPMDVALERDLRAADEVLIDRDRFRQVLVNLVDNAAQALKDAAWAPSDGKTRRITMRTESAGPHVRLSIADNGPGIAPEVLPKIFEPLFTTKSFGVGLGLPTVRQIVEQHGATIDVTSTVGIGTTFIIFLPRHGAAQPAAEPAADGSVRSESAA